MIGRRISHYEILEKLGEGGMGVVYKAHDAKLDRTVALKFLPHALSANETERLRFFQEAKAASALNHPNICTIYYLEDEGEESFIVMEYVDGTTLREKLPVRRVQDAIDYAIQIGEALNEAHSKGIVHRDIKADNIMLNSRNQVKVMDFGLAKLRGSLKVTRTSSTAGTLAYMAPEQIQGGEVDARSDIFSFGVVLFEMLANRLPFRGEHAAAVMYSILNEEPDSLLKHREVSTELDRIIRRALEKGPEDRYQHVDDMLSEIRRLRKTTGQIERPPVPDVASPSAGTRRTGETLHRDEPVRERRTGLLIASVGAAAILGAFLLFRIFSAPGSIDSLAVLPFEDAGAPSGEEYLADGLTESIINNLTKISSLRVVPRSTVFRLRGKDMDVQEIGASLGVSAVLMGRITHRGDLLAVQVDLIDIREESQLWGNRYQVSRSDVLTLQEDITRDVATRVGIGMSNEAQGVLAKRYTEDTRAYQLYLQGRYYWNKRTAIDIERSIDYLKQAIGIDSSFALAYAGLADCYIIQPQYAGTPTDVTLPLAQKFARKALELDNTLAEARTGLAFTYYHEWKYDEAEKEFQQSIALNPRYATTYHWYNIMLLAAGRFDEAWEIIQRGHALDPFSPVITLNVGLIPFHRGRPEEAIPYFRKTIELDPSFAIGHAWLGMAHLWLKEYGEAEVHIRKAVELSGSSSECIAYQGYFYGRTGKRNEALALARENEARYHSGRGSAYDVARIYAGLGEKENTLKWLERDVLDRGNWIAMLGVDALLADSRKDPRVLELVKKIGITK